MKGKKSAPVLSSEYDKIIANSKRSQVTIFIIIAVALVAGIILLFAMKSNSIGIGKQRFINPNEYIDKCAKDSMSEAIEIMLPQGGYLNPENYIIHNDNKAQYLCYTTEYYKPCINQEPLFIEHLEKEIKKYSEGKIKDCFYALEKEYGKRKYEVEAGSMELKIELEPKQAIAEINKKMKIKKNEEVKTYENFKIKIISPLYDFAIISQEIVNQEAKFCYFEYLGYSLLYPSFKINKEDRNSDTKIYSIEEKTSRKKFVFAVRSCAFPAGM